MIMSLLWILLFCILLAITLTAILNTLTMIRLLPGQPLETPSVSVLIPARNEAAMIANTLKKWQAQTYPNFEVVVLDDNSEDGTFEQVQAIARSDKRIRIYNGQSLPSGWTGKNWACAQLFQRARGRILLFTDADVDWEPDALGAVVAAMKRSRADVFTIWPTQYTLTWSERIVVPLMNFSVMGYLPEIFVRYLPSPAFAAANGQGLAFQRRAYSLLQTHAAVRSQVVEDVALARRAKQNGLRLVMALGDGLVHTRMYHNWHEVRAGFAKNILAGHGNQPLFLLLSTFFHWMIFLFPWIWLLYEMFVAGDGQIWPPLTLIVLGVGARMLSAAAARHNLGDAFLMPVSVLMMTAIAAQSLWWHLRYGGPQWKGRHIVTRVS